MNDRVFMIALNHVLKWETTRFTNHVGDLGGPTKYGVTLKTLSWYRKKPLTEDDVKAMTYEEAAQIYYDVFWLPNRCDAFKPSIAVALFDGCVNQSALWMRRYLQQSAKVKSDGKIGPVTIQAVNALNEESVLQDFMALRALRYADSSTLARHGRGWYRRLFDTHTLCLSLIERRNDA